MTYANFLTKSIGAAAVLAGLFALSNLTAHADETEQPTPARQNWTFAGPIGGFDKAQFNAASRSTRKSAPTATSCTFPSARSASRAGRACRWTTSRRWRRPIP